MRAQALLVLTSTLFAGLSTVGCLVSDTEESADDESRSDSDEDSSDEGGASASAELQVVGSDDSAPEGKDFDAPSSPQESPQRLPGLDAIEPPANDQCGGELQLAPTFGSSVTVTGSTTNAADNYDSWCGDTSAATEGRDVVYRLTVAQASTLDLEVTPTGTSWKPTITIRKSENGCATAGNQWDYCVGWTMFGGQLPVQSFDAGEYFVIIDSENEGYGDFSLTATVTVPACGDGALASTEVCDDGNTSSGDGCSASCAFEAPQTSVDACAGVSASAVVINKSAQPIIMSGYTTGQIGQYAGSCSWGVEGPDSIYHVMANEAGTMTVTLGDNAPGVPACNSVSSPLCWDRTLYVRRATCADGEEMGCSDPNDWKANSELSFAVEAGEHFYLFVDGYDAYSYGPFNLAASVN